MNKKQEEEVLRLLGDAPAGELLLAEAAMGCELSPTLHQMAIARYQAIGSHLERDDSPLKDKITLLYPQGSMAINATIRSHRKGRDYDLDVVVEMDYPADCSPSAILDQLYEAVNGKPGSTYFGKVTRQTRCVTVQYEGRDPMHIDLTPSVLLNESDPRYSNIFHAKENTPPKEHYHVRANPHGFARYYDTQTPDEAAFRKDYAYLQQSMHSRTFMFAEKAESETVPEQKTLKDGKSPWTVALQLLKRNRNIRYEKRSGRMPASVMLSSIVAEASFPGASISKALEVIIERLGWKIQQAMNLNSFLEVCNPICRDDKFTDRWPSSMNGQQTYFDDLLLLRNQLRLLMGPGSLASKQDLLRKMFGEKVGTDAFEAYSKRLQNSMQSNQHRIDKKGTVRLGAGLAGAATVTKSVAARPHNFYGERFNERDHG